ETPAAMPTDLREGLVAVLDKFIIQSSISFSFEDQFTADVRTSQPTPGWRGAAPPAAEAGRDELLVKSIQTTLYGRCYARRVSGKMNESAQTYALDPEFARRLATANTSRERWDKGWTIYQLGPNGQIFVRKGDRERAAMPGAFISDAMALHIGATVSLRAPRDTFDIQPGYYFVFGETLDELADQLGV